MTVRRPRGSSAVALNPFGLFSRTYRLASGLIRVPPTFTESVVATLYPMAVTTSPLTCTAPVAINTSASRRVHTPESARYRFNRMGPLDVGVLTGRLPRAACDRLLFLGFGDFPVGLRLAAGFAPPLPRPPGDGYCFMWQQR